MNVSIPIFLGVAMCVLPSPDHVFFAAKKWVSHFLGPQENCLSESASIKLAAKRPRAPRTNS